MLEKIAFLTMPSVAVMIVTSDWLVRIVLGPKWAGVATILQILGAVALIQPIANTTGWLFITQGRTDELLVYPGVALGWQCHIPLFISLVHRSCIGTSVDVVQFELATSIVEPFLCSQRRFWEC